MSAGGAERLAEIMTDADCASAEYPFSDESRARAVLASDWLAKRDQRQFAAGAVARVISGAVS